MSWQEGGLGSYRKVSDGLLESSLFQGLPYSRVSLNAVKWI